ncbi:hypothetical protein [Erysipelothrix rhusiopathiae]|nr:hypothetical protein [Erysipelothrix rhusiopathiae]MDE8253426.1 hypothetical protein [Erysipelothrix rhusiopathiae]
MSDKEKNEKMIEGEGVINRSLSSETMARVRRPESTPISNTKEKEK